ncbi:MAG: acyltransferase, partial [Chloroflexota bacterium]
MERLPAHSFPATAFAAPVRATDSPSGGPPPWLDQGPPTTERHPRSAPVTPGGDGFRPDIEGLRGIAVLVVVLFHAWPGSLAGGFIGVDVFFVISGYLITGLLVRERRRTGGISLPAFYARRMRRLLPAACVALLATLIVAMAVVPPIDRPGVAEDAKAAVLSIANIRFAMAQGDYFATVSTPSPLLHYWSLALEEQFYLVWPALILFLTMGGRTGRSLTIAVGILTVASLVAGVVTSDLAPAWAFYSLPTRAWQLGVGALLVLGLDRSIARGRRSAGLLGWAGLAGIIVTAFVLDGTVAYPGWAAIGPTCAAAAVIAAGVRGAGPGRLLAIPPLRFLGRISYSLYLWHWPILVLVPLAIGVEIDLPLGIGLIALSVLAAILSWRFIETPFRGRPVAAAQRPRRTVSLALASILAIAVLATGISTPSGPVDTVAAAANARATAEASQDDDAWVAVTPPPAVDVLPDPDPSAPVDGEQPAPSGGPSATPAAGGDGGSPLPSVTPSIP